MPTVIFFATYVHHHSRQVASTLAEVLTKAWEVRSKEQDVEAETMFNAADAEIVQVTSPYQKVFAQLVLQLEEGWDFPCCHSELLLSRSNCTKLGFVFSFSGGTYQVVDTFFSLAHQGAGGEAEPHFVFARTLLPAMISASISTGIPGRQGMLPTHHTIVEGLIDRGGVATWIWSWNVVKS